MYFRNFVAKSDQKQENEKLDERNIRHQKDILKLTDLYELQQLFSTMAHVPLKKTCLSFPITTYSRVQKSIENFVFRPKMAIFRRAGMREGGLPLPLAFQYLIFLI